VLGIAGAEVVYFLIVRSPAWWWLLSAAIFVLGMGLLAKTPEVEQELREKGLAD